LYPEHLLEPPVRSEGGDVGVEIRVRMRVRDEEEGLEG
jgi:hypothetical protein